MLRFFNSGENLSVINGVNITAPRDYLLESSPVTIFRFELNGTHLPGPRYMAFGPSVIALEVPLPVLLLLIAALAGIMAAWYIQKRYRHMQHGDAGNIGNTGNNGLNQQKKKK